MVNIEPKKLDLSLKAQNANCPDIVVKSLDGRPFSITGFQSNGRGLKSSPGFSTKKFWKNIRQ